MHHAQNILILALVCGASSAQGGLAWQVNPANGHAYALSSAPVDWHQSEALAVQLGGHLATIRNATEHAWLAQTFGSNMPEDTRIWIGLTDEVTEGTWLWSSRETVAYTNWGLFEPDNNGDQDHAALWLIPGSLGGGWRWCDEQGANGHAAIIEATPATATFSTTGVGCQGSQGTPILGPFANSLPHLGTSFQLELASLPQGIAVALGALGFSDTAWASTPLPRDLALMGMPGCTQYVSIESTYFMLSIGGSTTWTIPIPAQPGLVGATFFVQALVPDQSANAFGATVTNAGVATIGG